MQVFLSFFIILFCFSCSYLHHLQVGEIDNRKQFKQEYFEVKVNELGVNTDEVSKVIQALMRSKSKDLEKVVNFIALFQVGPRTGNPVYNEKYAEKLLDLISLKCPDGRISGVQSVREMNKYPTISGEIVKVSGYCLRKKDHL